MASKMEERHAGKATHPANRANHGFECQSTMWMLHGVDKQLPLLAHHLQQTPQRFAIL